MVGVEDPKMGVGEWKYGGLELEQHMPVRNILGSSLFGTVAGKVSLALAVATVTWLILNQRSSSSYGDLLSWGKCQSQTNLSLPFFPENVEMLKNTLSKAAMADGKTVIITTLNAAWTDANSIFDLFLESFRIGNQTQNLLRHLVVAALDQTAYQRCLELDAQLYCYHLITAGVNFTGEASFMMEDYLKMMWRRIDFLRIVLELGFNFVFTIRDVDVLWLRNPFHRFYPDVEFQTACDHYSANATDRSNLLNGGFNYVKSSNLTIEFYKIWYRGKDYFPGKHDQDVLNIIKLLPSVLESGLEMRFLDTAYYGGFCELSEDLDLVVTMHAICCVGIASKLHAMQMVVDDWKRYTAAMAADGGVLRNTSLRSWTVPRPCG